MKEPLTGIAEAVTNQFTWVCEDHGCEEFFCRQLHTIEGQLQDILEQHVWAGGPLDHVIASLQGSVSGFLMQFFKGEPSDAFSVEVTNTPTDHGTSVLNVNIKVDGRYVDRLPREIREWFDGRN